MPIGHENNYGNLGDVTDDDLRLGYAAVEIGTRDGPHAKVKMAAEPKP